MEKRKHCICQSRPDNCLVVSKPLANNKTAILQTALHDIQAPNAVAMDSVCKI